jgi:hypothetical protein
MTTVWSVVPQVRNCLTAAHELIEPACVPLRSSGCSCRICILLFIKIFLLLYYNIMYNVGCVITVARILYIMYMLRSSILAVHILAELLLLRTADTPARSPKPKLQCLHPGALPMPKDDTS